MSKGCSILAMIVCLGLCLGAVARADPAADEKQLVDAATKGDLATVVKLLRAGVSPDARDERGLTALNWAAYSGHLDVVKALVTHKATVDSDFSKMRWTPLANAAATDHLDIVKYLVAHKADVNALDDKGGTPLGEAAYAEHVEIAKFLLDHGAQIEATTTEGKTPLFFAVDSLKDDASVVKLLLKRGAKPDVVDHDGTNLIEEAAKAGNVEVAQLLIARGLDATAKTKGGITPLELAAREGKTKMIEFLLAHGAQIEAADDDGLTALMNAAGYGFPEAVTSLLDHGAKLEAADTKGATALSYALGSKQLETGKVLVARGAEASALFAAAVQGGDVAVVQEFLDVGVKADQRASDKDPTPLMIACTGSTASLPIVQLLLDRGADAGIVMPDDSNFRTPLMWAAYQCNGDLIKLLLAHGAGRTSSTAGGAGTALEIARTGWTNDMKPCSDDVIGLLR